MERKDDPFIPDLLIDKTHPLYPGVMAALEAFAAILQTKIQEYSLIDARLGNTLKGFQDAYLEGFAEILKYTIKYPDWSK